MKIVIAGGSGFLGSALATALLGDGHPIAILSRRPRGQPSARVSQIAWNPDGTAGSWASALDGAGGVINLAGESLAAKRWTPGQKQKIFDSRVLATRSLVAAIAAAAAPPSVLISGSAVGYYGPLGDEVAAEDRPSGRDCLAGVCVQWEAEAMRAAAARTRVVLVRAGLVLDRRGGALPKMLPPFWFGAGGPLGSGRQYWPWIHVQDWVDLVRFALVTSAVIGPINATAPNPVQNAAFARALGRAVHRPALLPTPGLALKLMLGEMAEALLLSGQRAVPAKVERLGHVFAFTDIDSALHDIFAR
jgi:uncharacterized protein (TIGR01777 family)